MFGLQLKPGRVHRIAPFPELCLRLTNAVLVSPPKNPRARVVIELCEHPDQPNQDEDEDNHVAIAVLKPNVDSIPLNIFINSGMGLRISGKNCQGAVVHVTGNKFTPEDEEDEDFPEEPMTLSDYMNVNPKLRRQSRASALNDDDDGTDSDDEDYEEDDEDDEEDDGEDDDGNLEVDVTQLEEEADADPQEIVKKIKEAVLRNKEIKGEHIDGEEDDDEEEIMPIVVSPKKKNPTQSPKQPSPKKPADDEPLTKGTKRKAPAERADESTLKKAKKAANSFIKHPSGLRYQDLIVGTGRKVKHGHNVALQYTLRLENGKVVDKADRRRPFKFRLGVKECIKGFDIGVKDMREGGERHIVVPPELGYGDRRLGDIPANSTLYFDVSLIKAF